MTGLSANRVETWLRDHTPPIIGRIENDRFIMDPRTLQEEELDIIEGAFERMLSEETAERGANGKKPNDSAL